MPAPGAVFLDRNWTFSHGLGTSTAGSVSKSFPDNDTYTVTLSRLDSNFIRSEVAQAVVVENTPPVIGGASDRTLPVLDTWTSDVTISDPGSADNPSLNCVWDFGDGQT